MSLIIVYCNFILLYLSTIWCVMQKITLENILDKKQHWHILNKLAFHPKGLTLHELTYLLTRKKNMYQMSELHQKFKHNRENIFKSRQRIFDCLQDLIKIRVTKKEEKIYIINIGNFHYCIRHKTLKNDFEKALFILREEREEFYSIEDEFKKEYLKKEDDDSFFKHNELNLFERKFIKSSLDDYKKIFPNFSKKKLIELFYENYPFLKKK